MKDEYYLLSDFEIWKLISNGSQDAFAYIYTSYSRDLYKYGFKFTQNADLIEDVIQDVYVHIWELRKNLIIQKSIKFYLFSSFRREMIKKLSASHNKNETLEEYHFNISWQASFQEILSENHISLETGNKIAKVLDTLPERQKEAIYLRYIQELSYEEISTLMEIQIPSLYNLIFKGIKTIKENFSDQKVTTKTLPLFLLLFFQ